ncbi:hypothetical protein D3C80_1875820 [compost metagenome]
MVVEAIVRTFARDATDCYGEPNILDLEGVVLVLANEFAFFGDDDGVDIASAGGESASIASNVADPLVMEFHARRRNPHWRGDEVQHPACNGLSTIRH